jgi:hypothetical protein
VTIVAYPLDAVSGAPSYTGEMVRQALSVLFGAAPSGRPLGAVTGVRGGSVPGSVFSVDTANWYIGPHSGVLDLETSATAGPLPYAVKTTETGALTAANATNDRIDIVYLQQNDPAEGDGSSTPAVVSGYRVGTAAPTPVAPAAPNSRCMIIGQVYVPKSGTGSPTSTFVAPTTSASGQIPAYSYGSTTTAQGFASGGLGIVNTWTLTQTKNLTYSNGMWTVQVAGVYAIDAALAFASVASPTGLRQVNILINGTQTSQAEVRGDASFALTMQVGWGQSLAVGDTIQIQGFQSQGTSLALSGAAKQNFVSIRRTGDA